MESLHLQNIYKARNNILEYLRNSNYNIDKYSNFSMHEISAMHTNNSEDMIFKEEGKHTIYFKFHTNKALRVQTVEETLDELINIESILTDKDILVFITKLKINQTLKKYFSKIFTDRNIFVIQISLQELQFNLLEHTLVPKHSILTNEEALAMKKQYNILNNNQIPEISRYDPVIKAIFAKPGDIIKIDRPSKTAITSIYYRYCINK